MDEPNQYQCIYVVNAERWKSFLEVRSFFAEYADQHYGSSISEIDTPPTTVDAVFTVEVDSLDIYNDLLRRFIDVLPFIDTLSFRNTGRDSIEIGVCVKNVWEVVESHE